MNDDVVPKVRVEIAYRTAMIQIVGEWCLFYRIFIDREGGVVLEKLKDPCACKFHVLRKIDPCCVKSLGMILDVQPFPNIEALLRAHIQTLDINWDLFWKSVD